MKEAEIRKRLSELSEMLRASPLGCGSGVGSSRQPAGEPTSAEKPTTAPEALDQLRLGLTYLLFDVEATRRENRYLRQMLEMQRRQGSGDGPDKPNPAP
ncbi:MAG: hypothetical protein ACYTF6_07215 [Planctomycetota bacterium]